MHKSSVRGIVLSIAVLLSITFTVVPSYAEEIDVTSIALEETTIIELTNEQNEDINTFRIWVSSDFNFKSFKTEKGWVGEKTPQGVIVFTSSEPIKKGESVKFGVKTDKVNSGINWKALDSKNKQIDTGKVLPKELSKVTQNPDNGQVEKSTGPSISAESIFRIVPEKPNIGSSIRVTGDKFGVSQEFDFYINSKKIGSFVTDKDGHFMTTMKIPEEQKADRADFIIKDKEGEEKKLSLRIGEIPNRIPPENIKLTVQGIPNIVHRGDLLEIFGTGSPGKGISITITSPDGEVIRTRTTEVDSKGNWELEPLLVPLDRPFGKYMGVISDGKQNESISWTIESDKVIIITPTSLKFEPGEIIRFNGTALPNKSIELVLEDPLGTEIFSDIIEIDESGSIEFEFPTTQSTAEGTYTLIATQEKKKELIFVGLGQLPTIPVNLEFDKLNYKSGDSAIISLTGKASEIINLLIIDPSDKPKGESQSIKLAADGRASITLDLKGYATGVYTAVISKGGEQSEEIFTVGLLTGSGEININTTKLSYHTGDPILILGNTAPNVLLTVTMTDPDGKIVKTKETFSNKNGKISEGSFRIPSDGKSGTWTLKATSGSNFDNTDIEVQAVATEGMIVSITEGADIPGYGKTVNISIVGAQQTVQIEIIGENNNVIEELSFPASKSGEIKQPWIVPKDTEPGIYTIKAKDAFNSAETTFEIK
ncbi:biofilm-associated protein [Nitrosopumilus ureiphilus]|uniref:Biofilm-associated protein n=1 Tax=Nitrosopumilus ureiphilus TaxID=1470067 RepID=A0A7D5MA96_9ARCH|nr:biofilm-associated protein [Nitrosopumilus ureiphilus]QLH08028.1 biofilm-associated protein [Nitrosopumilus ureiphilus]